VVVASVVVAWVVVASVVVASVVVASVVVSSVVVASVVVSSVVVSSVVVSSVVVSSVVVSSVVVSVVVVGGGANRSSPSWNCLSWSGVRRKGLPGTLFPMMLVPRFLVSKTICCGLNTLATWTARLRHTTWVMALDLTQTRNRVPRTPTTAVGVLTLKSFSLNFKRSFAKTRSLPRAILKKANRLFFRGLYLNCSRLRSPLSPILRILPSLSSILSLESEPVLRRSPRRTAIPRVTLIGLGASTLYAKAVPSSRVISPMASAP